MEFGDGGLQGSDDFQMQRACRALAVINAFAQCLTQLRALPSGVAFDQSGKQ